MLAVVDPDNQLTNSDSKKNSPLPDRGVFRTSGDSVLHVRGDESANLVYLTEVASGT